MRTDLKMGRGKIAAQVGHACVMGAQYVQRVHPDWFEEWWPFQEKVVVRVDGYKAIQEIRQGAIDLGVPWHEVTDAGRTQVEAGTTTCISLGPAPEDLIDRITGELRLL